MFDFLQFQSQGLLFRCQAHGETGRVTILAREFQTGALRGWKKYRDTHDTLFALLPLFLSIGEERQQGRLSHIRREKKDRRAFCRDVFWWDTFITLFVRRGTARNKNTASFYFSSLYWHRITCSLCYPFCLVLVSTQNGLPYLIKLIILT